MALTSLFKKIGCKVVDLGIIKDCLTETKKRIQKNLDKIDILVTTGGVSNSSTDNVGKFLKEYGRIIFGDYPLSLEDLLRLEELEKYHL